MQPYQDLRHIKERLNAYLTHCRPVFGCLEFFGASDLSLMRAIWRSSCHKDDE